MFVTFEGPEGAGKSSVIRNLSERLDAQGVRHLCTREPGAGTFGKAVRSLLLEGEGIEPRAEVFLFLADRSEHISHIVRPALDRGEVVLCDRHADSTVVYQGHARGFDVELLRQWNQFATGGLRPDLTLLLDLPAEIGLARLTNKDRLDAEPLEFHQRVRQGFLKEAGLEPDRWRTVDASRPLEEVAEACWQAISHSMGR